MVVSLTVSETFQGTAYADALAGGGTGIDLGSVVNNSYAPLVDKVNNQGAQEIYIAHDGTAEITDVATFLSNYTETGASYGGADSALNDLNRILNFGQSSGNSKNNNDGLSGGLWIDMRFDSTDVTRFDQATSPTKVKIYGDNGTDGINLASAFAMDVDAMVQDTGGGVEGDATTPVEGTIGPSGNTVLGEAAHIQMRIYWPDAATVGGIHQVAWNIAYAYTV